MACVISQSLTKSLTVGKSWMLQTLPDEILCDIINHLPTGITCILLLRQVSKRLNAITYDRSIWDHAYRTSSLVRPPGPFAWQTAHMLESNLIQSARLSLNWPPNNAKPVRSRVINISGGEYKLVLGRWLFTSHGGVRILRYNLESPSAEEPRTLYECREKDCRLKNMQYVQTLLGERSGDENHPIGFLLVTVHNAALSLTTRTLYSVILADGIFPTLHFVLHTNSLSLMRLDIGPRLLAIFSPSPGLQGSLFVDIETYQRYKFPESPSDSSQDVYDYTKQKIVISSSHVLLFRPYQDLLGAYVQAYAIPPRQGSGSESLAGQSLLSPPLTLQLTHEGTTRANLSGHCTILRDSKVDQITKTVNIVVVVALDFEVDVAVSIKLNPVIQSIGSIAVESPKNTISDQRTLMYSLRMARSLNGSTRSVTYFGGNGIMHVVAMVLDDEDRANSHTTVNYDMRCFQELRLNENSYIVGFDAYRGRLVIRHFYRDAITIFDFV
ncbi:hypothetical protein BJ138DRAFT_941741 [Hygrophoropsis aurantiaca]|uniref:Uncharacterized protein n=1 Tax=Hygrophoropsis aurantiaca TaxID=72124 RepID=A0ACB8ACR6_9AGAM|nr:hypothetical protein BJ138DRAFT_941741 [Hygrophoropsis aurantiaca]